MATELQKTTAAALITAVDEKAEETSAPSFLAGWWRLMEFRIGIVPLPVYLLLLGIIASFVLLNKISGDISLVIAIMVVGGFTFA